MVASSWSSAFLILAISVTVAGAEEKPMPWHAIVRGSIAESPGAPGLTARKAELVRRVNAYFNQLTMLEGSFLQTASDGKVEHGLLHIKRPSRFRFEFAPPNRVVVLSDGSYVSVQDYGLNTNDRQDLRESPFRALLAPHVDLARDTRLLDVRETGDTLVIEFAYQTAEAGRVTLFLAAQPIQLKGWIVHDNQNLDTKVDLKNIKIVDHIDDRLFDASARLERRW